MPAKSAHRLGLDDQRRAMRRASVPIPAAPTEADAALGQTAFLRGAMAQQMASPTLAVSRLPAPGEEAIRRLQQTHGNQAVQRYLGQRTGVAPVVQRDGAPPPSFSPLQPADPLNAGAAIANVLEREAKETAAVNGWLDQHPGDANSWAMGLQSLDGLLARLRQETPAAATIEEMRLRHTFLAWATAHNVRPQGGSRASGDVLRARLEATVQSALGAAAEGLSVTLIENKGPSAGTTSSFQFNISVQGATAKLKVQGTEAAVAVAYDKGVKASIGNDQINFSAELKPDGWSVKLNIGLDPEVPDLHSVGDVFRKAQDGLTTLVGHPDKATKDEVAGVLRDTGDAFDGLQGIAKAPSVSASISAGSTDPGGAGGSQPAKMPKGWQVVVALSGTF
jgi:hypothetical protein